MSKTCVQDPTVHNRGVSVALGLALRRRMHHYGSLQSKARGQCWSANKSHAENTFRVQAQGCAPENPSAHIRSETSSSLSTGRCRFACTAMRTLQARETTLNRNRMSPRRSVEQLAIQINTNNGFD